MEQKPTAEGESTATCDETEEQEEVEEAEDDSALNGNADPVSASSAPSASAPDLVTVDHLEKLAGLLREDWSKLAAELNFPDDDVAFFASESEDTTAQALKMLTIWRVSGLAKYCLASAESLLSRCSLYHYMANA